MSEENNYRWRQLCHQCVGETKYVSRVPIFPDLRSGSAMLLRSLVSHESVTVPDGKWTLQIYDLESRGWPLQVAYADLNVLEVRLDLKQLSARARKLLPSYLRQVEHVSRS